MNGNPLSTDRTERALHQLARDLVIDPAPDYSARVLGELAARRRPNLAQRWSVISGGTRRLLIAAAVLLLSAGVTVAVPASRHALASWLGFSGIEIRAAPSTTLTPPVTPQPLDAGRSISLREARAAARGRLELPTNLGAPDAVFLLHVRNGLAVTLAYRHAARLRPTADTGYALIVTEVFDAGSPLLRKIVLAGGTATRVEVGGQPGVFVEGPQEIITVEHGLHNGVDVVNEIASRTSANTLIWSDAGTTLRIEGDFGRAVALQVATGFH